MATRDPTSTEQAEIFAVHMVGEHGWDATTQMLYAVDKIVRTMGMSLASHPLLIAVISDFTINCMERATMTLLEKYRSVDGAFGIFLYHPN